VWPPSVWKKKPRYYILSHCSNQYEESDLKRSPQTLKKPNQLLALLPLIGYYFDNASFLYFVSSVIEASSGGLLFGLLSYVVVTVNIVER